MQASTSSVNTARAHRSAVPANATLYKFLKPHACILGQHRNVNYPGLDLLKAKRFVAVHASRKRASSATASPVPEAEIPAGGIIEDRELHVEASESYLAYAMSVIVGRALPDVRDGLKPVHRRILYAMHDLGLSHSKPFKKCARVVGEVLGKYHPHGDTAVYDALVRMAQDFSMRHTLVSGHGNFGSLDDDPPAAMRYTECRLEGLAEDMLLADLDQDVVDFTPTFDASQDEPVVLPAALPNLLINGTQGIAVGIATKIPPHNMREVVNALSALIHNPDITNAELRKHVPAPDFPTGNVVAISQGVVDTYEHGHGSVVLRAAITVETDDDSAKAIKSKKASNPRLVITHVPYQSSKAEIVEQIAKLVEDKAIDGIADIRDESDRNGTRVVVEVKSGASPDYVKQALFKQTRLETRFATNMVALVDGTPKQLSLKQFLQHFLDFRIEVIERRARHQVAAAEKRLHIVSGFLTAMQHIDLVVQLIRSATDTAGARSQLSERLMLSKEQADAVLALPLRRLTKLETNELQQEQKDLEDKVRGLKTMLGSRAAVLKVIETEAHRLADKYGSSRLSTIVQEEDDSEGAGGDNDAQAPPAVPVLVFGSAKGFIQKVGSHAVGGRGKPNLALRSGDALHHVIATDSNASLIAVTPQGRAYRVKVSAIPDQPAKGNSGGVAVAQVVGATGSVAMAGLAPLLLPSTPTPTTANAESSPVEASSKSSSQNGKSEAAAAGEEEEEHVVEESSHYLVMVTKQGTIKRTPMTTSLDRINKNGTMMIKLKKNDEVVFAGAAGPHDSILLGRSDGKMLKFPLTQVTPSSKASAGVIGMRVDAGEEVVSAAVIPAAAPQDSMVYVATQRGKGKTISFANLKDGTRSNLGVLGVKTTGYTLPDRLATLQVCQPGDEVVMLGDMGASLRVPAGDVKNCDMSAAAEQLLKLSGVTKGKAAGDGVKGPEEKLLAACTVPWKYLSDKA